jgi:polygalacturonase
MKTVMKSFRHLQKRFLKKYPPSRKERLVIFFGTVILLIAVLSASVSLFDSLKNGKPSPLAATETAVDPFPSRTITIETPFSEPMTVKEPMFPDRICSITDYGATASGKMLDTDAFRKAIDDCAGKGGGKVLVPRGTWLTGPIRLKSNIELRIERDATLLFDTDFDSYLPPVFSRFEGIEYENYSPLISATDATNVAITGTGTIDGQGKAWWPMTDRATPFIDQLYAMGDDGVPVSERVFGSEEKGLRPAFIEFLRSKNILIEDVTIRNGPMWTIHPVYSSDIIIRGVSIETNPGPSTDGVAIDSSSNVLIEGSTFDTGDDAIVLKSGRDKEGMRLHVPTENVVIRNCTVSDSHGAIAIGSEMSGDIRNVFATGIAIDRSQYGFRIKATRGRGGIVEHVWVENVSIKNASIGAIDIVTNYGIPFREYSTQEPIFRDIHIRDFSAEKTRQGIDVEGLPDQPIQGISFENISLATGTGIKIRDVDTIDFKNTLITIKKGTLFTVIDSANITIADSPCAAKEATCLSVSGEKSGNITIQSSAFEKSKIKLSPEVRPDAVAY